MSARQFGALTPGPYPCDMIVHFYYGRSAAQACRFAARQQPARIGVKVGRWLSWSAHPSSPGPAGAAGRSAAALAPLASFGRFVMRCGALPLVPKGLHGVASVIGI